jgi:hypothetical protein
MKKWDFSHLLYLKVELHFTIRLLKHLFSKKYPIKPYFVIKFIKINITVLNNFQNILPLPTIFLVILLILIKNFLLHN